LNRLSTDAVFSVLGGGGEGIQAVSFQLLHDISSAETISRFVVREQGNLFLD
jgi:hypothetical protein